MISTNRHLIYPISLISSIPNKKTCESLSEVIGISGDTVLRLLDEYATSLEMLIQLARLHFADKKISLVLDDTIISKIYSKYIEGSCDNYDSAKGIKYRSLCSVTAVLTDGRIAMPIAQELWISEEFSTGSYKKKFELALDLIARIKSNIDIDMVLADGLYATTDCIKALVQRGIFFEMRFHSNRVIEWKGLKSPIRDLKALQLKGRRCQRTRLAQWKGMLLHFTSVKRFTKRGKEIITYQVSNRNLPADRHTQFYSQRWCIEEFFRTAKQYLGLNDCRSRKQHIQENHIMNVFLAYALLQLESKKKRLSNPEEALKRFDKQNFRHTFSYFSRSAQILGAFYA
jgi:SRSO17 transposase